MTAYAQAPTIAQAEAALAGRSIGHAMPHITLANSGTRSGSGEAETAGRPDHPGSEPNLDR